MKKGRIYLIPIGDVDKRVIRYLLPRLNRFTGVDAKVGGALEIPPDSYSPQRNRYMTYPIMRLLKKVAPEDALRVTGICNFDLCTPVLDFVFGEAQLSGKVCLISTFRPGHDIYSLTPSQNLFYKRLFKIAIHELGHTFGLVHCRDDFCTMHFSGSLIDIDIRNGRFCPECADKFIKQYKEI